MHVNPAPTSDSTSAPSSSVVWYRLKLSGKELYLDIRGGSKAKGAHVIVWQKTSGENQLFRCVPSRACWLAFKHLSSPPRACWLIVRAG